MAGIFISRGMKVTIPSFTIRFSEDGELDGSPIALKVWFDVAPTWIEIANRHLSDANAAKAQRNLVWLDDDGAAKARALEREFEASMQAVMASAIAWDALYATLRELVSIPESVVETWRKNRTARYIQVAETVRRAFKLKQKGAALLRKNLKTLYSSRDMAVHPSGKTADPLLHPERDRHGVAIRLLPRTERRRCCTGSRGNDVGPCHERKERDAGCPNLPGGAAKAA